jgi:hypothetical protein
VALVCATHTANNLFCINKWLCAQHKALGHFNFLLLQEFFSPKFLPQNQPSGNTLPLRAWKTISNQLEIRTLANCEHGAISHAELP